MADEPTAQNESTSSLPPPAHHEHHYVEDQLAFGHHQVDELDIAADFELVHQVDAYSPRSPPPSSPRATPPDRRA